VTASRKLAIKVKLSDPELSEQKKTKGTKTEEAAVN
jgi:hypothetical protein